MFCKNCGQAIADNAKFCTSCGTAIEHPVFETTVNTVNSGASTASAPAETEILLPAEPPVTPPQSYSPNDTASSWEAPVETVTPPVKKKRTGVVFLCIGLMLVILAAILAGIWAWGGPSSIRLGNTPSNLYCGGLVAEQDGTVYFSYAFGTYKQTKDGTHKIYDTPLVYLNVASDGTLYGITEVTDHLAVVHIDSNGRLLETMYTFDEDIDHSRYMFLVLCNKDLFIQSGTSFLKLHIPSNEWTTLESHIQDNGIMSLSVDETGLYYAKESGSSTECYRMPFSGETPAKCSPNASMYFCSGFDFYSPVVNGNIYFFDDRELELTTIDTKTDATHTFRLNTIGEEVGGTTEDIPVWTSENEMYCIMNLTDDSGEALCRITFSDDGTAAIRVLATGDFYGYRINVVNNQVYCIFMDDDSDDPVRVYDPQTDRITSIL